MKKYYTKETIIEEIDKELEPLKQALSEAYKRRSTLNDNYINRVERRDIDAYGTHIVFYIAQLEKIKEMVERLKK